MNKNELLNLLDDTDNLAMQQFIGSNESKVVVNSSFQSVEQDYSWIDKIEETIIYLDNIIRNPKKFIMQEEEIVPGDLKYIVDSEINKLKYDIAFQKALEKDYYFFRRRNNQITKNKDKIKFIFFFII